VLWPGHLALAAALAGSSVALAEAAGFDVSADTSVGFVAVAAAAGVAPDIDTHNSLITKLSWLQPVVWGVLAYCGGIFLPLWLAVPLRLVFLLIKGLLGIVTSEKTANYWMKHRGVTHDAVCAVPAVAVLAAALVALYGLPWWVALAVPFGWAAHIAGDWPTLSGVPFAMWRGDRDYKVWRLLRFRVGSRVEQALTYGLLGPAAALVPAYCWA
jgi:hypothetical protein